MTHEGLMLYSRLSVLEDTVPDMFRSRLQSVFDTNHPSTNNNPNDYFNAKLMMYGTGAVGAIFMLTSIAVFSLDSIRSSMYILIVGMVCIILMILGIKILTRKWRHLVEEIEEVLHSTTTAEQELARQEITQEKPPTYSDILRDDPPPPSYENAIAMELMRMEERERLNSDASKQLPSYISNNS